MISIFTPNSGSFYPYLHHTLVGDFNNDSLLDLALFSPLDKNMYILPGYGNGTFGTLIVSSMEYVSLLGSMTVGDFNRDN